MGNFMLELLATAAVAGVILAAAVSVVIGRNLVHSVLMLGVLLFCTAVLFILLEAPFLAGIQVMLYAGGVVTLMLFAIMLTRRSGGVAVSNETLPRRRVPALLLSFGLGALVCWSIHETTDFPVSAEVSRGTKQLGYILFTDQALSLEVLGVLLLAATIGAIVLARRRDYGESAQSRAYPYGVPVSEDRSS
jgi:NADH-quinone oxidoreductase subunit J